MKLCKDCIFYWLEGAGYKGYERHTCLFDAITNTDLVTGKVTYTRVADCYKRREFGAICGELGRCFKSKDGADD